MLPKVLCFRVVFKPSSSLMVTAIKRIVHKKRLNSENVSIIDLLVLNSNGVIKVPLSFNRRYRILVKVINHLYSLGYIEPVRCDREQLDTYQYLIYLSRELPKSRLKRVKLMYKGSTIYVEPIDVRDMKFKMLVDMLKFVVPTSPKTYYEHKLCRIMKYLGYLKTDSNGRCVIRNAGKLNEVVSELERRLVRKISAMFNFMLTVSNDDYRNYCKQHGVRTAETVSPNFIKEVLITSKIVELSPVKTQLMKEYVEITHMFVNFVDDLVLKIIFRGVK